MERFEKIVSKEQMQQLKLLRQQRKLEKVQESVDRKDKNSKKSDSLNLGKPQKPKNAYLMFLDEEKTLPDRKGKASLMFLNLLLGYYQLKLFNMHMLSDSAYSLFK